MIIVSKNTNPAIAFAFHEDSQAEEIKLSYQSSDHTFTSVQDLLYMGVEVDDEGVETPVEKTLGIGEDFTVVGLKAQVPEIISKRQFYQQLGLTGVITKNEASIVLNGLMSDEESVNAGLDQFWIEAYASI